MPEPKKLSTGMGRVLEDWPPIPVPARYRIEAVLDWLYTHRNQRRKAECLGWLLTVICELELAEHYLPSRRRLAHAWAEFKGERVKDTAHPRPKYVDSIDSAIASALAEGEVNEEWLIREGAHARRPGVVKHRYLRPSKQLMMAYGNAERARVASGMSVRLVSSR